MRDLLQACALDFNMEHVPESVLSKAPGTATSTEPISGTLAKPISRQAAAGKAASDRWC